MEWLKRVKARLTGRRVCVSPEIAAQPVERTGRTIPACTLTSRYRDCWENGCLHESDCQYRKASILDRHLADTGKLPGMTKGDW